MPIPSDLQLEEFLTNCSITDCSMRLTQYFSYLPLSLKPMGHSFIVGFLALWDMVSVITELARSHISWENIGLAKKFIWVFP